MATINFLYRSTKNEADLNIRLLFRNNNIDNVIGGKTKIKTTKTFWDETMYSNSRDAKIKNIKHTLESDMYALENFILNAFDNTITDKVDKEWLKLQVEIFYNPLKRESEIELSDRMVDYIDYYIKVKEHEVSSRSITKFRTIKKKLSDMELFLKRVILIKDVDEVFKSDFISYYKANNYAINTTQKELAFVKTFCKHARHNGIKTSFQLDGLTIKKEKVAKIYLSFKEIEAIEKTDIESKALQNARDWLIISCFTGQRVSDFMRFTKDMIREEEGIELLEFEQVKTKSTMSVAVHPKVRAILNKNNGEFPRPISDQKYNLHIKDVCKEAKLTSSTKGSVFIDKRKVDGSYPKYKLISSHIGRRSYATNFFNTIPTSLLRSVTGHSSEQMLLTYIGKTQTEQAKDVAKYY